jgi:hypothetical protein
MVPGFGIEVICRYLKVNIDLKQQRQSCHQKCHKFSVAQMSWSAFAPRRFKTSTMNSYRILGRTSTESYQDRLSVLSALFRSAPDGIVKDDGPTEFAGFAALLSSVAAKH